MLKEPESLIEPLLSGHRDGKGTHFSPWMAGIFGIETLLDPTEPKNSQGFGLFFG